MREDAPYQSAGDLSESAQVRRLYCDGVQAVVAAARRTPTPLEPVCGTWSATDLIRHLVVVVEWYEHWLDRAIDGLSGPPFPAHELDVRNRSALASFRDVSDQEAVERFERSAIEYLDRASQHFELAYGFPFGTTTVAQHLGAAAAEWHLHAWDLDHSHAPDEPGALFVGVATAMASTRPNPHRWLLTRLIPLGARRSPWVTLLRQSGRTP